MRCCARLHITSVSTTNVWVVLTLVVVILSGGGGVHGGVVVLTAGVWNRQEDDAVLAQASADPPSLNPGLKEGVG